MPELHVGEWVRRVPASGSYAYKWHKVTTDIADRTTTYCGRQMRARQWDGGHLEFIPQLTIEAIHRLEVCIICKDGVSIRG